MKHREADARSRTGYYSPEIQYAVEMQYVFVNGNAVVDDGEYTGALPGRALRGPAYNSRVGPR